MRITSDTPIEALYHSEPILSDDELLHWKYIKREKINGKWRYYYDWNQLKSNTSATISENVAKTSKNILDGANKATKHIDTYVTKAKSLINKWYDDPKNIYDVSSASYKKKLEQIKQTDEWKKIVSSNDEEYVKTNKDGTKTYLIDDYIIDKKHPILDVMGDIIAGRDVDVNEITKDTVIAGIKDHAIGYLRTGMLAVGVISTFFTEKFKLQQGSYDDDIKRLQETADRGKQYLDATIDTTTDAARQLENVTPDNIRKLTDPDVISEQNIEQLAKAVRAGQIAAEARRSVDEGNVVQAAQIIADSDMLIEIMGSNEYYALMRDTLGNLTPEETAALNLLMKQLRK